MPRPWLVFIALSFFAVSDWSVAEPTVAEDKTPQGNTVKNEKLRQELLDRMEKDQVVRRKLVKRKPDDATVQELTKVDRENTAWLQEVIERQGWPGQALVGEDGAHAAWILVQHADLNPTFQKKCLELLTTAVKRNDASRQDLAYLTDRVRVADKQKQVYGTQLRDLNGKLEPHPIDDEEHVDDRRKEAGLPPLAEYLKAAEAFYSPPKDE
ncbi:MAG TPA: DUF6624 domain-containing protein [Pirellulales bacterium]|nr:DUF6624 domain-containing protein [Pirellulales bacterium]